MISLLNSGPEADVEELPAKSSPPWVWVGFFFAFLFLVCEFFDVLVVEDHELFRLVLIIVVLSGWIYWLGCVHRFHKILGEMSRHRYPITGGEAVGRHFIPFYNFVWIVRWPAAFSDYLNSKGRVKMISGYVAGTLLLLSVLLRFVEGALGLAATFAIGLYLSAKLRAHMKAVKGSSSEMLPPLPDPRMFGATRKT